MSKNVTVEAILEALSSARDKSEARQLRINPEAGSLEKSLDFVAAIPATLPRHFYDMDTAPPMGLTTTDRESFGSRFPHFFAKMLGDGGVQKVLGAIEEAHPHPPKYMYSAVTLYACTKDLVVMLTEAVVVPATGDMS